MVVAATLNPKVSSVGTIAQPAMATNPVKLQRAVKVKSSVASTMSSAVPVTIQPSAELSDTVIPTALRSVDEGKGPSIVGAR